MKIFNVENGKEKIYVQLNDLIFINKAEIQMPTSIYMKVFSNNFFILNKNKTEFVSFDEPNEIEYFKGLDFILDYDSYKKLSLEELTTKRQKTFEQYSTKVDELNGMFDEEKKQNKNTIQECEILDYVMNGIQEFYWLKKGEQTVPFPQASSSSGFKFIGDDDFKYEMSPV